MEYDFYNRRGGYQRLVGEYILGKPCPRCGTAIQRLKVLGSACYLCPTCQKQL